MRAEVVLKKEIVEDIRCKEISSTFEKTFSFNDECVIRRNYNYLYYFDYDFYTEEIPESLNEFIKRIILREKSIAYRNPGIYRLGDAKGFIERVFAGDPEIIVTGSNIEEVSSLFLKIKSGEINPTEPWDRAQRSS